MTMETQPNPGMEPESQPGTPAPDAGGGAAGVSGH